jgi:hypothetical protein
MINNNHYHYHYIYIYITLCKCMAHTELWMILPCSGQRRGSFLSTGTVLEMVYCRGRFLVESYHKVMDMIFGDIIWYDIILYYIMLYHIILHTWIWIYIYIYVYLWDDITLNMIFGDCNLQVAKPSLNQGSENRTGKVSSAVETWHRSIWQVPSFVLGFFGGIQCRIHPY